MRSFNVENSSSIITSSSTALRHAPFAGNLVTAAGTAPTDTLMLRLAAINATPSDMIDRLAPMLLLPAHYVKAITNQRLVIYFDTNMSNSPLLALEYSLQQLLRYPLTVLRPVAEPVGIIIVISTATAIALFLESAVPHHTNAFDQHPPLRQLILSQTLLSHRVLVRLCP